MKEIECIFRPDNDTFTIFIVEQRFAVQRGYGYFRSYFNTPSYIDSDKEMMERFTKTVKTIEKNIPPVAKLISSLSSGLSLVNIRDAATSLCKLFTVHEHQAAGAYVIDPIILQEGKITQKAFTRLINLHKNSIVQPTIIIVLKDNDFTRAKTLLAECPNGMNIKMIRNSGEEEVYKIINDGAQNIDSFIDSFAEQCYSTCSKTKKSVLLNSEWSSNPVISNYAPMLFKIRSNLLLDQKEGVRNDLSELIASIPLFEMKNSKDVELIQSIDCMAKLFRVFCHDFGGQDIIDAEKIAKLLGNEILLAHVYRYAEFFPNCSDQRKEELYTEGYRIFRKNNMVDHAIYCKNNMLVQQFYSDHICAEDFRNMQEEAVNNVPGLVGLSHIYNNVGVAYLYSGLSDVAIEFFNKGLDYAKYQDRIVQRLALESNKIIAESYSFNIIDDNRLRFLMRQIIDGMGMNKLPFLAADYALNVLVAAYHQNPNLGWELINTFAIEQLINASFSTNLMGSGERLLQMQLLASRQHERFPLLELCKIPNNLTKPSGRKMEFIQRYGYSPFDFNTWL